MLNYYLRQQKEKSDLFSKGPKARQCYKNKIMKQKIILGLFMACLIVSVWQASLSVKNEPPQFNISFPAINTQRSAPDFSSQIIPQPAFLKFSHSSSITHLKNGDLLVVWFAGSREGSPDVKIWQSRFSKGKWSMAIPIASNFSLMHDTHRYISKLGNPVIYQADNGVIHLFIVSAGFGGWSVANLNHLSSTDNGITWGQAKRIISSPFLNIATLNRTTPVGLEDGGFYLPVYQEFIFKYPEMLRFNKDGEFVQKIRISTYNTLLQPSVVAINRLTAYAYMRNNGRKNRVLYREETSNGGLSWSNLQATNFNNYDSSLVVARIKQGLLLMVYNDKRRSQLDLATSHDGLTWVKVKVLENYTGSSYAEFSYPSIAIQDDQIDLVYTWYIQNIGHYIKHVNFNLTWLESNNL